MSDIKDIETDAVNIDGSENIASQGIDEANSEAAKAARKLKDARDKDGGERGRGGGFGIGKVAEFLGDSDRGRDR
ncbi:MAG: hypothetical protein A4E60_01701 [Syntrophorhabdus sp. PtaB.Bin047]|jgi:hypothetical protein|nr:MAG: hypothetical protein A4E60_01701 [Syntrophorhabdus sp. PtaB.Bin047]